ncbi:MAG: endo-1,4-beta-xylanase, partial [Cyanobacteria bacterium P01_E01_bin.48]
RVHMVGFDGLPWFGSVFVSDNQLVIQRNEDESGTVHVPWRVAGWGEMLLSSSTLMERDKPYQLEVELARGVVHRLRNQLESWRQLGLMVPATIDQQVLTATRHFSRAAARQNQPREASQQAVRAIELAVAAGDQLASTYAEQVLEIRTRNGQLTTLLGVKLNNQLPPEPVQKSLVETLNLVSLPMSWRDVEMSEGKRNWQPTDHQLKWAQKQGLKMVGGPLIEFDERRVPDWTYLWEGDHDTISKFMLEHVRQTVKRYRGKVHLWHVAARMNRPQVLSLSDEERLQMVASAIHEVRQHDPRTPVVVSFDQPLSEYMSHQAVELAPLHYADALVRADLGLSGLGLELNIGPQTHATSPRTPLAFSQLIDQWGLFELPLFLTITVDSAGEDQPDAIERPQWVEHYLPSLLAKNCVQVVVWNQLSDQGAEFPGTGLYDSTGNPKPMLNSLATLRKRYLA